MGKSLSSRRSPRAVKRRKSYKIKGKSKIKGTKRISNATRKGIQRNIRKKQNRSRKNVTISKTVDEFTFFEDGLPVDVRNSMNITRRTKQ